MKKFILIFVVTLFLMSILLTGCGPKKASQEQLTQLDELKQAADAAEAQISECQTKTDDLNTKIADLEKEIENLKNEINNYK